MCFYRTWLMWTYVSVNHMAVLYRYIPNPDFEASVVKKASTACEGLVKWVRAMDIYDSVAKVVAPKKEKLAQAESDLATQMTKLNEKRAQLQEVIIIISIYFNNYYYFEAVN